ncbi:MAG: Fe(2+) transporter permease subunit FeoB [Spirochaetota bacterium]
MKPERKSLTIAVAGNPNCGKTTIFNALTGSDQKVGNWPGVTVEKKEGIFHTDTVEGKIIDLPGIYSLSADSEDEVVARKFLAASEYDLVINVVDASNLERNLYLTMQLREMHIPVLVVINKLDLAAKKGFSIDLNILEAELKAPVIGISATSSTDLAYLSHEIDRLLTSGKNLGNPFSVAYPEPVEEGLAHAALPDNLQGPLGRMGKRAVALALIEEDPVIWNLAVAKGADRSTLEKQIEQIRSQLDDSLDVVLAEARYEAIEKLRRAIIHREEKPGKRKKFNLDSVVMHRIWGVPIFFGIMFIVFTVTLTIGGAFIDFFDILFGAVFVDGFGSLLELLSAPQWMITLLAGGVGGGIQTISTFIPIIFSMFLMLGILEDSGYMARAAFVMDRFMRFVGLPGKAFVPMLVGFGCTVPAIMATRTLDSRRDRFLTIFMTPFMSCGARLPVYALFAAAFFGARAGLVVFSIYLAGIMLAVVTGLIMKKTLFKGDFSPFIMELPEYNVPKIRKVSKYAWDRLNIFMYRAGKIILVVVVVLTLIGSWGLDGSFGNDNSDNSVLSYIGRVLTPVMTPMGIEQDNWPATVGLFAGIFAKEAVVGTLNTLYLTEAASQVSGGTDFNLFRSVKEAFAALGENLAGLLEGITDPLGIGMVSGDVEHVAQAVESDTAIFTALRSSFTPAASYAYMLFVLIYAPCVAAMAAAFREAGKFYGSVLVVYLTVLAWIVSVLFYQIAEGGSLVWIAVALTAAAVVYISLILMGRREQKIEASSFL